MANPHKGEVGFDCGGKAYTLRFSANALCELEDVLDAGINVIAGQLSDAGNLRLKTVRAVFWAGLRDHHADVTLRDAGEIVTAITLARSLELIGKAFEAAFPDGAGEAARPTQPGPTPAPAAGTGPHSSANGASLDSTTIPSGGAPPATLSAASLLAKAS